MDKDDVTAIRILPDSPYDLADDSDLDAETMPRPGDKVMIYGLKNREELNRSHCILLQFDHEAQRWGVELMAFGTRTGKQLAIKPANLRFMFQEVGGVSEMEGPKSPEENDADARSGHSSGSFLDDCLRRGEFWSGGSVCTRPWTDPMKKSGNRASKNSWNSSSWGHTAEVQATSELFSSGRVKAAAGSKLKARARALTTLYEALG
jgi:hypothetical protein